MKNRAKQGITFLFFFSIWKELGEKEEKRKGTERGKNWKNREKFYKRKENNFFLFAWLLLLPPSSRYGTAQIKWKEKDKKNL